MYLVYRNYKDGYHISDHCNELPITQVFGACTLYLEDADLTDLLVIDKNTGAVIVNYHKAKGN